MGLWAWLFAELWRLRKGIGLGGLGHGVTDRLDRSGRVVCLRILYYYFVFIACSVLDENK